MHLKGIIYSLTRQVERGGGATHTSTSNQEKPFAHVQGIAQFSKNPQIKSNKQRKQHRYRNAAENRNSYDDATP